MTSIQIAASTMAADAAHLGDTLRGLADAGVDLFHWDIMDGHFVPNLTFGPQVLKDLRRVTKLPFDVHLLVTQPMQWIESIAQSGADSITFHIEATDTPHDVIRAIRKQNVRVGLAVNPETALDSINADVIAAIDRLVIMTVKPGFGGQSFIPQENKIRQAAAWRAKHTGLDIMVDGGINLKTAPDVIAQGATTLVSGSALLHSASFADMIAALKGGLS